LTNIKASFEKFVEFRASGKEPALRLREAQVGECSSFSTADIGKAEEMPPAMLVHFLNVQLKRKLLNRVVYKFP
jgi:hypothetical protein